MRICNLAACYVNVNFPVNVFMSYEQWCTVDSAIAPQLKFLYPPPEINNVLY